MTKEGIRQFVLAHALTRQDAAGNGSGIQRRNILRHHGIAVATAAGWLEGKGEIALPRRPFAGR